ncbi:hypothetical protein [Methylovirgula sp. HY1]|uniref:hypothetical protein n=1 Tax=Methylovirgula sp. HY1 TaxID=2822761 RepID=UPI001C5B24E6|nr:hypothetical protein [Methylovirgula sp. HY1]QXX76078.1 hypothetical protein MHY1_02913 [Methylovirgula sp. HY1]
MVTPPDIQAQILRYYHAEKWTIGTISRQLRVHHDVVRRVLAQAGLPRIGSPRKSPIDAYLPFIRQTLEAFPSLTASRLYGMVCERGYRGRPVPITSATSSPVIGRVRRRKPICVCSASRANRGKSTGAILVISGSAALGDRLSKRKAISSWHSWTRPATSPGGGMQSALAVRLYTARMRQLLRRSRIRTNEEITLTQARYLSCVPALFPAIAADLWGSAGTRG